MALVANQIIQAKIETVSGTFNAPAAGDAILCSNLQVAPVNARMYDRDAIKGTLGALGKIYGGSLMQVTFDVEVKGSGSAGTAPELDAILQSAGFAATVVASTSVTYDPASTGLKTCSVYVGLDGKRIGLKGCVCDINFDLTTGAAAKASVTMLGKLESKADASLTATYDSTVPAALIGVPFTVGAYGAVINALSIAMGNTLAAPPDISDGEGYGQPRISSRTVTGSFDPEQVLIASKDFDAEWRAGTKQNITTGVIGSTAGNRVAFTMQSCGYDDVQTGEREGILTHNIPFTASEVSGDDELEIVFT